MVALALLTILQTASAQPVAQSPGEAAAAIFREGCVEGTLRLTASRGRFLKRSEIPTFADVFEWRPAKFKRVIKFNYPHSTYLAFAEYKKVQPKSIVKTCALISGVMSEYEAAALFLEGVPDKQLFPETWHYITWTSDHPELGYRKILKLRDDDSVVLQVSMYANPADRQSNSESKNR